MKLPLAFETELKAKIDGCLLNLKEQGEEEFNKILKEQRDEIVDAFKESIPLPENVNPDEVQKFIQKYIKAFWQKYKKTEGSSPDKIGKRLASEFKNYFVSMIDDDKAQKEYPQEINPTDKEIIVLNQIADMFLETKNKQGKDILLQIEFEAEYNTDKRRWTEGFGVMRVLLILNNRNRTKEIKPCQKENYLLRYFTCDVLPSQAVKSLQSNILLEHIRH